MYNCIYNYNFFLLEKMFYTKTDVKSYFSKKKLVIQLFGKIKMTAIKTSVN